MVHIIEKLSSQRVKSPSCLGALDALKVVEEIDLALKRNQLLIMKYLPKHKEEIFVVRERFLRSDSRAALRQT